MAHRTYRIGTRASKLALAQTGWFARSLTDKNPDLKLELVEITTEGDVDRATALSQMGGEGLFTKRLELALLENEVDIAVHSAKDLPSRMTENLTMAAVPPREFIEDVLITRDNMTLDQLEAGAVVGTGSPRRRSQILHLRPDLKVRGIRGNVETRIRKLQDAEYDTIVMARAGLRRSGLDKHITEILDPQKFVPAPGQGALAIQSRAGDDEVISAVQPMNHADSYRALEIERLLLATLEAGCSTPVGGFARVEGDRVLLRAVVLDNDGTKVLRAEHTIEISGDDNELVKVVADTLLEQGARELIEASNG
jgi:hydroxymethylbilane synthase